MPKLCSRPSSVTVSILESESDCYTVNTLAALYQRALSRAFTPDAIVAEPFSKIISSDPQIPHFCFVLEELAHKQTRVHSNQYFIGEHREKI